MMERLDLGIYKQRYLVCPFTSTEVQINYSETEGDRYFCWSCDRHHILPKNSKCDPLYALANNEWLERNSNND